MNPKKDICRQSCLTSQQITITTKKTIIIKHTKKITSRRENHKCVLIKHHTTGHLQHPHPQCQKKQLLYLK